MLYAARDRLDVPRDHWPKEGAMAACMELQLPNLGYRVPRVGAGEMVPVPRGMEVVCGG